MTTLINKTHSGVSTTPQSRKNISTNSLLTTTATTSPKDGDTPIALIVGCVVGGIFLLLIFTVCICLYKKHKRVASRRRPSPISGRGGLSHNSAIDTELESGKFNSGLDASVQEIDKVPEKASIAEVIDETLPEDEKEEVIHNVSIKLLTTWNAIYTMIDSEAYITMKELVQNSMETIYMSYDDFESATLLKFRKGSVIADVQLRFEASANEPLALLEKAIKTGRFADLEVDKSFFELLLPNLKTVDGFTKKRMFGAGTGVTKQRIESGYYDGSEDEGGAMAGHHLSHLNNKLMSLNIKKKKQRGGSQQLSTKSTQSHYSMTSEMGGSSSYVSSTNISIISGGPEEEGVHGVHGVNINNNSSKKKTGMLPHFNKQGGVKKVQGGGFPAESSLKKKSNLLIGEPHIALFDFQPQDYRELKLTRGELVRVISVDSGGWAKAMNQEKKYGWIPQNFVIPIDPKKYQEIKIRAEAITTLNDLNDVLDEDEDEEEYHFPRSIPVPRHENNKGDDSDSSDELNQLFVTIYPYEPTASNELKLEVADLIDVLKTSETGWWKGQCLRTQLDGWFPSSYVKPYIHEFVEDDDEEEEDHRKKEIPLSDSELIKRTGSSSRKILKPVVDGYSSDNGEVRTKIQQRSVEAYASINHAATELHSNTRDIDKTAACVVLRPKKGSPKERAVSLIINTNEVPSKLQSPAPLTPPPRLSNHSDHGTERTFAIPPSKPVPPPPRQKHIEKEYNNLVASGKLGSQDSLKAVSTECLASLGRSPHHPKRGGSGKRRNSEEIMKSNFEGVGVVMRRTHDPTKLNRTRPKSFQAPDTSKTPFLCLANRYQTSIKPAFSLPSLVGDQVKLSPDDDRPFLDPIPRRNKSRSLIVDDTSMAMGHHLFPERNCSSLKDLSVAGTESTSSWSTRRFRGGSVEDISRESICSNSTTSLSSTSLTDVNNGLKNKPLPPEPQNGGETQQHHLGSNSMMAQLLASKNMHHVVGSRPPLIAQKPVAPPRSSSKNNIAKKLIEDQRSRQNTTDGGGGGGGGSGSSGSVLLTDYRTPPFIYGRLRQHISFESINEESEQASTTPNDEAAKLPGGGSDLHHDHRRSRSEPHDRILLQHNNEQASRSFTSAAARNLDELENNAPTAVSVEYNDLSDSEINNDTNAAASFTLSARNLNNESNNMMIVSVDHDDVSGPENNYTTTGDVTDSSVILRGEEKGVRTLTYDSRASSLQSLTSVASSVRSTASSSSKHEQQNLRRAVMNVHGQGPHDLSYEAGAVLYECRPKNKHGLCYGILDNSTEGWFPAESVEPF